QREVERDTRLAGRLGEVATENARATLVFRRAKRPGCLPVKGKTDRVQHARLSRPRRPVDEKKRPPLQVFKVEHLLGRVRAERAEGEAEGFHARGPASTALEVDSDPSRSRRRISSTTWTNVSSCSADSSSPLTC